MEVDLPCCCNYKPPAAVALRPNKHQQQPHEEQSAIIPPFYLAAAVSTFAAPAKGRTSGSPHDSMVVLKQESRYAKVNDHSFSQISVQVEQGIRVLPKWLMFNRAKLVGSKRVKLGPALFLTSATFGSVGGYMAPYQAIAIGGLGSIRGYGEGAVGSGRSCLILNNELTLPLNKMLEGAVFLDCGTDLNSGHHVPGNPAMRKGKPGSGIGMGYGLRLNCGVGQFQIDYAINAFNQKTVYFGISNIVS